MNNRNDNPQRATDEGTPPPEDFYFAEEIESIKQGLSEQLLQAKEEFRTAQNQLKQEIRNAVARIDQKLNEISNTRSVGAVKERMPSASDVFPETIESFYNAGSTSVDSTELIEPQQITSTEIPFIFGLELP